MKKLITDTQKMEIGKLGIDGHADALIAFGADMVVRGAVYATVGITLGIFTNTMLNGLFKKKPKTSDKNTTENIPS